MSTQQMREQPFMSVISAKWPVIHSFCRLKGRIIMTPDMRVKLRGMIMTNEDFRGAAYKDTTGHLTIGYGHNLDARPISPNVGGVLLDEDIQWALSELDAQFPWFDALDDPRKCVLVDMCYNLGLKGLMEFTATLECISRGQYINASYHMLDSLWAKQVGGRAVRNAHIMKTGEI